jgi:hypothetical protein
MRLQNICGAPEDAQQILTAVVGWSRSVRGTLAYPPPN